MAVRSGIGFDVHKLVQGRTLLLGGITIPFDSGLEGLSDGDVPVSYTHLTLPTIYSV